MCVRVMVVDGGGGVCVCVCVCVEVCVCGGGCSLRVDLAKTTTKSWTYTHPGVAAASLVKVPCDASKNKSAEYIRCTFNNFNDINNLMQRPQRVHCTYEDYWQPPQWHRWYNVIASVDTGCSGIDGAMLQPHTWYNVRASVGYWLQRHTCCNVVAPVDNGCSGIDGTLCLRLWILAAAVYMVYNGLKTKSGLTCLLNSRRICTQQTTDLCLTRAGFVVNRSSVCKCAKPMLSHRRTNCRSFICT